MTFGEKDMINPALKRIKRLQVCRRRVRQYHKWTRSSDPSQSNVLLHKFSNKMRLLRLLEWFRSFLTSTRARTQLPHLYQSNNTASSPLPEQQHSFLTSTRARTQTALTTTVAKTTKKKKDLS
ncbi:hypothetical protein PoB_003151900 [Plakobranchus ocellatus]|uniref:Uncharacterized protein n=1 Tax=Plakobranchus ocellatus TaxID=259542 RepID=A0AAV4ABK7_9GAST|nr:hypothetical protein PoB_003151900 [Plakobranchus ocellatus]